MRGKREVETPKPKLKRRTLFTIFAMFNLFWYTVVVLIANFHDHTVAPELTVSGAPAWRVAGAILFVKKNTTKHDSEG